MLMLVFAFSVNVYADVGKTASASSKSKVAKAIGQPFTIQTGSATVSHSESWRIETLTCLNSKNTKIFASAETDYTFEFESTIYDLPPNWSHKPPKINLTRFNQNKSRASPMII